MKKRAYIKWLKVIRHHTIELSGPKQYSMRQTVFKIKKSENVSICHGKLSVSGESGFLKSDWMVSKIVQGVGDRVVFPPKVVMEVKALACQLPGEKDLPFSRLNHANIAREAVRNGITTSISGATVWCRLSADAIKPWQYRSWIFPRDPHFAEKASRVLDLNRETRNGKRLGYNDFVISADEKTSIQARNRKGFTTAPTSRHPWRVEFEYERCGALAYLAAWDIRRAKVFGLR